jgi:AraC-like DNA-binding protein/ligand-binding sensor protein
MQIAALQQEAHSPNDQQLLGALARSKAYKQYERIFSAATGLPLALRPVEFVGLPFHGKKTENRFCAFLGSGKSSCRLCLQTQARCTAKPGNQSRSIRCPFSLTETTVPVRLGERAIGFLSTGQVFTHPPDRTLFKKSLRRLFSAGSAAEKRAAKLWKQTPFVEPNKYAATVQLLNFFARQLSAMSNQIIIEQTRAEPQVVTKARQFIAENKGEAISLGAVAQAAGASVFHFCKVFRKATGLKFTDYLSRVRLEEARTQLRNPNLRISEIAYDVGFQSLTQFNRTFQRIIGQSPSSYRQELGIRAALTP